MFAKLAQEEEDEFVEVLKKNKKVIIWSLADTKGIPFHLYAPDNSQGEGKTGAGWITLFEPKSHGCSQEEDSQTPSRRCYIPSS